MENDREKKVFRAQAISTERRSFLSMTKRIMKGCSDESAGGRR
jgi:hypothetical protein